MQTKTVKAADLAYGQEVIAGTDGNQLGFTVHAVTQAQGKVQVTDQDGRNYTFQPDDTLKVR